jgi:hypothetical protein
MVQINIKSNSFTIIDDNVSIISSINTTSYSVFPTKNTISFWNTKSLKTLGIYELDDTLVNSKQLTIDNYSEILDPIFKVQSENSINVIDNLESTSTTDALSANQGNVLKNLFNKRDYVLEGTQLKDFPNKTPQFGDLTFLTSNGNPSGELDRVYQYNGFNWREVSSNYNLIFKVVPNKVSDVKSYISPEQSTVDFFEDSNLVKSSIRSTNNSKPVILLKYVDGIEKLNEDIYTSNIEWYGASNIDIDNKFNLGTTAIQVYNQEEVSKLPTDKIPDFIFKNNTLGAIQFGGGHFKNFTVQNLKLVENSSFYLPSSIDGDIVLDSIEFPSADTSYISFGSVRRNSTNPFNLNVTKVPLKDIQLDVRSDDGTIQEANINISDIKQIDEEEITVNISGNFNLKTFNVDFDYSKTSAINFSEVKFESQTQLDSIIQDFLDKGFGSANINNSIKDLTEDIKGYIQENKYLAANNGTLTDATSTIKANTIVKYPLDTTRVYRLNNLTEASKGSISGFVIGDYKTASGTTRNASITYYNQKILSVTTNRNYPYLSLMVKYEDTGKSYDWTDTFKFEDITDIQIITLNIMDSNFSPSQAMLDKLEERNINVYIQ